MARFAFIFSFFVAFVVSLISASPIEIEERAIKFRGDATYALQGLGACGVTSKNTELVTAVSAKFFDSYPGYKGKNPNKNPVCGKTITVTYKGKTVKVKVTDRSYSGKLHDLMFSPAAFEKFADVGKGSIYGLEWSIA